MTHTPSVLSAFEFGDEEDFAAFADRLEIGGLVDGAVDRDGGFFFEVVAETRVEPVRCHAAGIDRGRRRDRPAGQRLLGRQLVKRQWREVDDIAAGGLVARRPQNPQRVRLCYSVFAWNGKTQYGKKHDDDRTSQTGGERET